MASRAGHGRGQPIGRQFGRPSFSNLVATIANRADACTLGLAMADACTPSRCLSTRTGVGALRRRRCGAFVRLPAGLSRFAPSQFSRQRVLVASLQIKWSALPGRKFRPDILAGNFGRKFRPEISAGNLGRKFRPEIPAGNSGRKFQPEIPAGNFGRKFWPEGSAKISISAPVPVAVFRFRVASIRYQLSVFVSCCMVQASRSACRFPCHVSNIQAWLSLSV